MINTFWKNQSILFVPNSRITEYDIKSGNTSIMRAFNLCDAKRIAEIESMKKSDRVIAVGNMSKDPTFAKNLEAGFNTVVKEFIKANELVEDDVIDVYRDAVFVIVKEPKITTIRETCNFVKKNVYQGYIRCGSFEFFIGEDKIDVKGMRDELLEKHQNGILALIREVYDFCVKAQMNPVMINTYMKSIVKQYIDLDFVNEIYREFNSTSKYKMHYADMTTMEENITDIDLDNLDISYNYLNIILPLIRVLC